MLENVLEKFKQKGTYAINLFYGEDIGADDLDIPKNKRRVQLSGTPIGVLGEARILYKTTLGKINKIDFSKPCKIVSNPPKREQIGEDGSYIWGTESAISTLLKEGRATK